MCRRKLFGRSICPHPRHIACCIGATCECERRACGSSPKHCATHTASLRCILAPISAQRGQSPALLQAAKKNEAMNMPGASYISASMVQQDKHAGRRQKIQAPPRHRQPRFSAYSLSPWSQERTEPEAEKRDKSGMFPRNVAISMLTQAGKRPQVSPVTSTHPVYPFPLSMCWACFLGGSLIP